MIKIGIIGATGYAGVELVRLLQSHPQAKIVALSSVTFEGKNINEVYPNLLGIEDSVLLTEDEVIKNSDVIFTSVPHGISENIAEKCLKQNKKMIDLGADFRLSNPADYEEWYGLNYKLPELHKKSCYCIPELHKASLKDVEIIGNPGCYPTSVALGLAPSILNNLLDINSIIVDSKSGVTGAGRGLSQTSHFAECNEGFFAYKVAQHRHTPEIEECLSGLAGKAIKITFVPHLLPVNRGIESTIYSTLTKKVSIDEIHSIYCDFYKDNKFVRIMPQGSSANIKSVKYSNYCDISVHVDNRTNRLIVCSVIDNMVKGASGQAIQNMNLLFGIDEYCGLDFIPPAF